MTKRKTPAAGDEGRSFEAAKRKRAASANFQSLCKQSRLWQATIDRRKSERA
jgi:hypothetical protein